MGTLPGQVATVGALDVEYQLTEAAISSRRNVVMNGLDILGQTAQAFSFVWSPDVGSGVGAFNKGFVDTLKTAWPDRALDQEKYLLSLGYRTDQHTAIAKDDHGSYYAFFPLSIFLTPNLRSLFLKDPAAFLQPAETFLDSELANKYRSAQNGQMKSKKEDVDRLRDFLLDLSAPVRGEQPPATEDERKKQIAELLFDLSVPCPDTLESRNCPLSKDEAKVPPSPLLPPMNRYDRVLWEKNLFAFSSLNVVKIVARGVMTLDVSSIPPTIDTVTIDNEKAGVSTFTVTKSSTPAAPAAAAPAAGAHAAGAHAAAASVGGANAVSTQGAGATGAAGGGTGTDGDSAPAATGKELTGIIAGKFLTDATPAIVAFTIPGDEKATQSDYIADKSIQAVSAGATDTSLPFKLQVLQTLPSGAEITFQVSRKSSDEKTGTSSEITSNKFVYTVKYAQGPTEPKIDSVAIDNQESVWQKAGKVTGTITGTDLDKGSVSVSKIEVGGKSVDFGGYVSNFASVPTASDDKKIDFQFVLKQKLDAGATVSFTVTTTANGKKQTSEPKNYTIPGGKAAPKTPPAKKKTVAGGKPAKG